MIRFNGQDQLSVSCLSERAFFSCMQCGDVTRGCLSNGRMVMHNNVRGDASYFHRRCLMTECCSIHMSALAWMRSHNKTNWQQQSGGTLLHDDLETGTMPVEVFKKQAGAKATEHETQQKTSARFGARECIFSVLKQTSVRHMRTMV